jgi:hypothetical protein
MFGIGVDRTQNATSKGDGGDKEDSRSKINMGLYSGYDK